MTNGDQLLRAYARMAALKSNLPDQHDVESRWVDEFHAGIDGIEAATGRELSEFRVPRDAVDPKSDYYKSGLWCERANLMQKIDATLTYFSGLQHEDEKRIGFRM